MHGGSASDKDAAHARRTTTHFPNSQQVSSSNARPSTAPYVDAVRAPRRGTAVAAVLGGDLHERTRREMQRGRERSRERTSNAPQGRPPSRSGAPGAVDDIDVELLLASAQKLCAAYPIPGARERIAALRARGEKAAAQLEHYEALVSEQSAQLGRMNQAIQLPGDDELDDVTVAGVNADIDRREGINTGQT